MTDTNQLNRALHNVHNYAGAFPADRLPDVCRLPKNSFFIANYDSTGSSRGGSHWVAVGGVGLLGGGPYPVPLFFDALGQDADQWDSSLGVRTGFKAYLERAALLQGHQTYYSSHIDLQCIEKDTQHGVASDICGDAAALFVRYQCLPIDPVTGRLNAEWKHVFSFRGHCGKNETMIRRLAGVR